MPKNKPLLPAELKTYVAERYLADARPREIVAELSSKFGVTVTSAQLRQWLTRSGAGAKRKEVERKASAFVSDARLNAIAKTRAASPAEQLGRWTSRAVKGAEKAFDLVDSATRPRDLASAASAAKNLVTLYRLTSGLEHSGNRPLGTPTFNFNFANDLPDYRVSVSPAGETAIDVVSESPKTPQPPSG